MMDLGFVSAILPDLSLDEVLATAADFQYDCVELMCWPVGKADRRYAGVTHVDVAGMDRSAADHIQSLVNKHGVKISGLGYYPNPLAPDAEESAKAIEHLKEVIKASALLNVNIVNTFIGRDWTRSIEENWRRFLDVWQPIIQVADEHDVKVCIENCPMLFSKDEWPGGKNLAISPAVWNRMFEDIPSPNFGLNYDPSHLVWQHIDPVTPIRDFADRIFHVHAKDVQMDHHKLNCVGILAYPEEFHTPKLPGLGEVNWGKFFAALGDIGYQGSVCVEVEDRAYEQTLESRKLALQQSCNFLRNYIPR